MLNEEQKEKFNVILNDLQILFSKDKLLNEEIPSILLKLKSEEVRDYIRDLRIGSKPEEALSDNFFAGQSLLMKYLSEESSPQINSGNDFIDFQLGSENKTIILEIKSLFKNNIKKSNLGKELISFTQNKIKVQDHKDQLLKYIHKSNKYVILTNLKE